VIVKRRVHPGRVVEAIDALADREPGFPSGLVVSVVNPFSLKGAEEVLCGRVFEVMRLRKTESV